MRYSRRCAETIRLRSYSGRIFLSVLITILFSSIAVFAIPAPSADNDEVKKLIKEASKLTRKGSLTEAEAILRRAIGLDSYRSEAKVELAYVLTKERRLREAYDVVFPVAEAEPKNARAYSVLGATLLNAGRFKEARIVFFTALKLDTGQHLAWAGYGMLDFYENKIEDSYQNLREAVFHEPYDLDYLFALAQVSARSERYREAAEAYKKFLDISDSTDTDRRARIKGLINFLKFLGAAGSLYYPNGADRTTVPFELVGNRPIIKLRINGRDELLKFVLDTGSGITVLSDVTAKRLKVKALTRGGYARGIGGDGKFEIVYGLLREVTIGKVSVRQVPIYLRKFHQDGNEVDGYIGLGLISKFLATIDYGNQTFSLTKKESDTPDFNENADLSLPLRLTSSGFLSGEVLLQGLETPLNFIVDTGASVSVISNRVAKSDGIVPFLNDEKLQVIGSAGITGNVDTFLLPRVSFGKHSRKDIMAVALDLDIINEASGFEQSGILGGNFLKNYRLTFDFKNSKVIFVPVKPENE